MRQRDYPAVLTQAAEPKGQRLPSPSADKQPMLRSACQSSRRFQGMAKAVGGLADVPERQWPGVPARPDRPGNSALDQ